MGRLSTKHAVLGLMIDRPSYGYNLQQQIAERLGFLGLAESTVYKTLERLEQDGWVEEVGQKQVGGTRRGAPRKRRTISIAVRHNPKPAALPAASSTAPYPTVFT